MDQMLILPTIYPDFLPKERHKTYLLKNEERVSSEKYRKSI